ncbi:conserved repeat domain-containing protein [Singulisphaera sp. GP187]|uniref:DUF58 domain-containing protein n=1 Tax=Singulisphaera sp. GP187 TaxID=1882752 RepID=UPI000925BFD0|nr:DUF58 domain-containing protein [Singulisphaera sp. GP187]SIO64827.1 conserved repeat domain-containing protein [Singulisphaera sp. GP187]
MRSVFVVILVLVVAVAFDLGLLAGAMLALSGLMLVSRFLARSWIANLEATRDCNRTEAEIGQSIAFVTTLRNCGRLPIAWVLIEEMLPRAAITSRPPRIEVKGRRLAVAMLGPLGRKTLNYQLHFTMRGYYQVGPLVLETGDLFGLHRRFRIATDPVYVVVYPKVVPLPGYDLASRRPIGEIKLTHRLFEDPTRIAGVRAYQPGDPLNRVHWAATARTGTLHSKVYDASTIAGATILLDFHRDAYPARNEPGRSELAVTTAVALANAVSLMGQPVGLMTNGRDAAERVRQRDEIAWRQPGLGSDRAAIHRTAAMREDDDRLRPLIVPVGRGPETFARIREVMARVELSDALSFDRLVIEVESRMPRDATVVAILAQVTPETAEALGRLKRQGFAVSVVLLAFDEIERIDGAGPLIAQGLAVRAVSDENELHGFCELQFVTPL